MDYPVSKGQKLEAEVIRWADAGKGVAQIGGLNVFVDQAMPGERVEMEIIDTQPRYALAGTVRVLTPSPDRIAPPCPVYDRCGGCCMQHMKYDAHLRALENQVSGLLHRVGGYAEGEYEFLPIQGMERPWQMRNKAVYRAGGTAKQPYLGFVGRGTHEVIPAADCLLQTEEAHMAARTVQNWMAEYAVAPYDERSRRGVLRHLIVRTGKKGETMVVPVTAGAQLPHAKELVDALQKALPGLRSVVQNVNSRATQEILGRQCVTLWGEDRLEDELLGLTFRLSPLSFYQVNPMQTERLYRQAIDFAALTGGETVADAYCGAGTIGLSLAKQVGIEIVEPAVRDAKENARRNGVTNAEFYAGPCEKLLPQLASKGLKFDAVVLDPPRKGCDEAVLRAAAQTNPARIVYVSCNPATLARDVARLRKLGYVLRKARPFDMFSWTGEVETVCLLVRRNGMHINVDVNVDEMLQEKRGQATYPQIKEYVLEQTEMKVSSLYISQVKRKCGLEVGDSYNKPKSKDAHVPQCPPDKEKAILDALRHFGMIS